MNNPTFGVMPIYRGGIPLAPSGAGDLIMQVGDSVSRHPAFRPDEMNPASEAFEGVAIYHLDRSDEIISGVSDWIDGKIRTKALFYGLTQYASRHPEKFAGRVVTRGIPYLGWALLAYDAIELYRWYQD